ncbi:AT-rich interactive domain-containing protein 5B [Thunnus maccoyii]|uniref:AT-rich interactive domain-containing protein 5B n=1 Tax=Thunnus maccoyii TaxID=8240 RepID=UPI001C4D902A|nr:AT-rich interactive domain-containing protein 5B [Thunnus maccoyii]
MEHNAIQWLGAPSCQRGSYAFYKSVSSRSQPDGPVQVWRLGEFYFIRCGPQDPVCIAEVTLLWEDQTQRHLLASARLYFLPEDTPKGRTREHGEDEVLAVSRKMVVRVEDLVRWSCSEPAGWSRSSKPPPCGTNGLHKPPESSDSNGSNNTPDKSSKPLKDKTENGLTERQGVKVLSYPQYCRFRSLQRRIQDGARGPGLQDPHLLALGGIRVLPSIRVLYCRDTFNHPTLESSTNFSWQFRCPSLSLRGRPRKRRGRDGKDSPNSSQSESWIERMKENVMGSVEVGCEGSWLPHPEEQLFLDQLYVFMDRHGSPIHKVPNLGFKKIDLFLMYSVVKRLGGYEKVTSDRLWKVVYNELGGCPGSTSAATCTRRHYERLMLPYEEHLRAGGTELKIPESPVPPKPRGIRGRKPLPRGRKPGPKAKKITTPPPAPRTVVNPDGTVVVKRGRGRPPGKRNKATLIAQAKLLAQQQAKTKAAAAAAAECPLQSPLLPPRGRAGPTPGSTHRVPQPLQTPSLQPVQSAILPANMPLTPDLSPMSAPFLPFQPKPKELKDRGECAAAAPGVLLSALPRHFVGGSLGGFSPIKGMCPLDVLRSRVGFQRSLESPALTPQDPTQHHTTIYTLQPKSGSPDTPQPSGDQHQSQPHLLQHLHNRCSGCNVDEAAQRGGGRDARNRLPLPPLRVLPLDLDCSVQVRQLMRTRLDSSQLQTFTRRLSEALSQDLSTKPPCSPITPPPEQALPLNLSKRFTTKRPSTEGPEPNTDQPSAKRPRAGCTEQAEDFSLSRSSCSGSGGGGGGVQDVEMKNQEEPADLSSPSRIRAFLLGLPPFQVKLEEDLTGMRFGKFLPPGSEAETQRTAKERGEGGVKKEVKKEEDVIEVERRDAETSEQKDPTQMESTTIQVEFVKGEDVEMGNQDVKEEGNSSAISSVGQIGDFGGQQMAGVEKVECDVEASSKGLPSPVLPQPTALVLAQQS